MECPVCYECEFLNGDLLWLECLHPLCRQCLLKLETRKCPMCRVDINNDIGMKRITRTHSVESVNTIRIRRRRRRRRRNLGGDSLGGRIHTDSIEIDNVSVMLESSVFYKKKRNINKCERYRKGKWANCHRQTYNKRLKR